MMNGPTSEEPGHKLKSWHTGEASMYSTDLTQRNCVAACHHRSRGLSAVRVREMPGWDIGDAHFNLVESKANRRCVVAI